MSSQSGFHRAASDATAATQPQQQQRSGGGRWSVPPLLNNGTVSYKNSSNSSSSNSSSSNSSSGSGGLPGYTDVVIVGAGPTGLTLALSLALQGVSFVIVDAAPQVPPESRALAVHARTLEILEVRTVA